MEQQKIAVEPWVLWKDDWLLVVNKPAGLRTIPDGYDTALPYLAGILQRYFGRVWVVHRLDRDTSGVMVFARDASTHKSLNTQFEKRETKKSYHALVVGAPEWEEISIPLHLRIDGDRRHRTVIDHQTGKPAETTARVLQRLGLFTLLEALPHTGYTHQVRAHLSAIGFPILSDPLYHSLEPETFAARKANNIASKLPIQRTALHANQITFTHPQTGQAMTIQAPYPADFRETINVLTETMNSSE